MKPILPLIPFNIKGCATGRIKMDHLLPTHGCEWSPYGSGSGSGNRRMPRFVYHKPIPDDPDVTWALGTIKQRTDGRWSWWRQLSPHWPEWRADQGVALTKMGAMFDVQEGWVTQEQTRLLPSEPTPMARVYEYIAPPQPSAAWYASSKVLGRVIDTHTGIWTWVRHKSKHHPKWKPGRGTSASCRLAHQNLMDGWE